MLGNSQMFPLLRTSMWQVQPGQAEVFTLKTLCLQIIGDSIPDFILVCLDPGIWKNVAIVKNITV